MKTAISIPDQVFRDAERLAHRNRKSRSELYSDAVREYVARHSAEEITDAYDRLVKELGQPADEFGRRAARRALERSEW